ncbi:MAG: hypothetical protein ACK5LO_15035 [Leucobacter sp.]
MTPRRGQQAKHTQRRADKQREANLEEQQLVGDYEPPPRHECTERKYPLPCADDDFVNINVWTWANENGIADFSLTAVSFSASTDTWEPEPLTRADICHGYAHIHILYPEEQEQTVHVRRIDNTTDVQTALHESTSRIQQIAASVLRRKFASHIPALSERLAALSSSTLPPAKPPPPPCETPREHRSLQSNFRRRTLEST